MRTKPLVSHYIFWEIQKSSERFYRFFVQPKMKFGSPQVNNDGTVRMRHVTKPVYLLKSLQKEINECLKQFELPNCMHGGVTERNNVTNALQHRGKKFFLTIDLKNFFSNISNSQVNQALIGLGFTWKEARIITRITTFKHSLPQGAPTSTTLANMVFAPTALLIEDFCNKRNIRFTVFVDDLTFSSSECFKHYTDEILEIIRQQGFFANQKKIRYRQNCSEITGLYVKGDRIYLPRKILANMDRPGIKEYYNAVKRQYQVYMTNTSHLGFLGGFDNQ